jgi:hypothetical protein
MSAVRPAQSGRINIRAALVAGAVCVLGLGLLLMLRGLPGPATRCEARGGHYLVGPGGETACVDRNTFLPMIDDGSR